jgi:hypothetical protein
MIFPGWTCDTCKVFNGEAKDCLEICRACGASRPQIMTRDEARELALSIMQGKPTVGCPIPFSYVQASIAFAKFVENGTRILRTFDDKKDE